MVAVDTEAMVATAEVVGLVVVAAAAAMVATEASRRSSPDSGTRCIANSDSRACTSLCSRGNPRRPHHCHGSSRRRIGPVRFAAVQQRPTAGLYSWPLEEAETQRIFVAAFGAQVEAAVGRRRRGLRPAGAGEGAVTDLAPTAVVEMAAVAG